MDYNKFIRDIRERDKKPQQPKKIHRCVICGKNPVDAENGYDTCEECLKKQ